MNPVLMLLLPEAILAVGLVTVLVADMLVPAKRQGVLPYLGVLVCALAALAAALGGHGQLSGGMIGIDGLALLARPAVLIATVLVLLVGRSEHERDGDLGAWTTCILGLALGGLVTIGASHLVSLYLGLELMSLSGYALAAWRGRDAVAPAGPRRAAEAGMKYVLFGSAASGLMLFGMSHLYGLTGHLDFIGIGQVLADSKPIAVVAALLLAGVGIAYKLAIVPFHFYAPDVYQGAPATVVAAIGTVPKIAAAAALVHAIDACLPPNLVTPAAFGNAVAVAAAISLLAAALLALSCREAKRIVAFSAIGHAGAVLLAIGCMPGGQAVAAAAFYLAAYAVANIGALVCLAVVERERGSTSFAALAGSMRRRPWLTVALCLFLFSLAGVPPLAGFLAKWGVLREALRVGLGEAGRTPAVWAALALLASTAISAWAYLLIVRAAVLALSDEPPVRQPRLAPGTAAVVLACAVATLGLGLWLDVFQRLARLI